MKKLFLFAAASLALGACDSNEENLIPAPVTAQITASIGGSAVTRASDYSWHNGDSIGITVSVSAIEDPFVNVRYITSNGDGMFAGQTIYIYNPMDLTAYYPFTGEEGKAAGIQEARTDAANQAAARQPELDFLYAKVTGVTTDNPKVNFNFSHKMSKCTLTFQDGNDGTDVSKIKSYKIEGLKLDGTFDTASGVCAVKNNAVAETLSIELPEGAVKSGTPLPSLIFFPQRPENVKLTIIDSEDQIYSCNLSFGGGVLEAGNNYSYVIKVSKLGLSVNSSIYDWIDKPIEENASSSD